MFQTMAVRNRSMVSGFSKRSMGKGSNCCSELLFLSAGREICASVHLGSRLVAEIKAGFEQARLREVAHNMRLQAAVGGRARSGHETSALAGSRRFVDMGLSPRWSLMSARVRMDSGRPI